MSTATGVTREAIAKTYERIRPHIRQTPILDAQAEDFGASGGKWTLGNSGYFKVRGVEAAQRFRPPAYARLNQDGSDLGVEIRG